MHDPFNRLYLCGATALVKGRVRNGLERMPLESIRKLIRESNFLDKAPFLWVHLSYRYGIKNDLKLEFSRIGKKYGDLHVALELDMEILMWADKNNLDHLHDIFMVAALEALIQVAKKYKLPDEIFIQERAKYKDIPNTIEECEVLGGKGLLK